MIEIGKPEFERRSRILDMMLTAHSVLRDRYERRSTGLTLLIMAFSIVATGVAFISDNGTLRIGQLTARIQIWVGVLTCVIFLLSIVELVVEWRRRAWAHGEAARHLADLKAGFRHATIEGELVHCDMDLLAAYDHTMDALVALRTLIPEAKFNRLKARHLRKVAVSRRISEQPERPIIMHRIDLLIDGLRARRTKRRHP
jgi:hypothetical protein